MSPQKSPSRFSPVRLSPLRPGRTGHSPETWRILIPTRARFLRLAPFLLIAIADFSFFGLRVPATVPGSAIAASPHGRTTVSTTTITIPTYIVEPALVQQFDATYNMSYYRLDRDRYDPNRIEDRSYTLVVLENDYLKLTILPELGGRIYQAIFKPTGSNAFYQNPVLKPSPWGPPEMGWWLAAGGMEWGLPVAEHGYEWGIPWNYEISDLADGARVSVWDTDANNRLRAMVSITLLDDQALFHVAPNIENPTDQPIDYKFWLNAMLAPGPANAPSENLRFIMPAVEATVHSTGDPRLPGPWEGVSWPTYNDVDWSRLGNWRQWFGFFQRPRAAGDFQAVYDEGYDEGIVRAYNSSVAQGVKFFGFGWGEDAIPPDLYTDDDSTYVEMHGGVEPTFAETHRLEPGQRITWNEQWYPVTGLGGLSWANSHVALHLEGRADQARVHVTTSSPRPNVRTLLLRSSDNTILFDQAVAEVLPGLPYHSPWVNTPGLAPSDLAVLVYSGQMLLGTYQFEGELPTPESTATRTITPVPTPIPIPTYSGRVLRQVPAGGWVSVVRIWVRGQYGLPVTIRSLDGSWSAVNYVGTKPEYGPDALEFAPLGPGPYVIEPQALGTQVTLDLAPGVVAEVLFEPTAPATPTSTVTPLPTLTPTLTPNATPPPTITPSPTAGTPTPTLPPTAVPTPTFTPTPTTTGTPAPGWVGRELERIQTGGWPGVVRIWVRGQYGLTVTIATVDDGWSAVNYVGSKPEYGPTFLEFAPLGAGS